MHIFSLFALSLVITCTFAVPISTTDTTIASGTGRLSWNSDSTINPTSVPSFTRKINLLINTQDQFWASPVIYDDLVVLAALSNNVYLIDANTGVVKKRVFLDIPFNAKNDIPENCNDINNPFTGVLSTPVIDTSTRIVYLTSKTYKAGTKSGLKNAIWKLHALSLDTLAEQPNFPIVLSGVSNGVTFNAGLELQRTGMLLMDGKIIFGFGSYCDVGNYHGWVFAIDKVTRRQQSYALASGSGQHGGGVWMAGMGASSTVSGSFYVSSGNGFGIPTLTPTPGRKAATMPLADSLIRFSTSSLIPQDFFTPNDTATLDAGDVDFGSGGNVLLPSQFGTSEHPNLIISAAKDGFVYVTDANDLGGFDGGAGLTNNIIQKLNVGNGGAANGIWGTPAVSPNDLMIYVASKDRPLQAFKWNGSQFVFSGATLDSLPFGMGSPLVTTTGTAVGTATVWVNDLGNTRLVAFNGIPDGSSTLQERLSIGCNVCKFSTPVAYKGRVYVGTCDGRFNVFG